MSNVTSYRIIISGGGTGGHIFPAIAIANTFKERYPNAEILFVGAKGKMEMVRVPEAGYKIVGLWISGLQRSLKFSNLLFPVKLVTSYIRAVGIIKNFKPHAVIGTGGYASSPMMMAATRQHIPTIVQEQNSFAGLANKQVARKVNTICVAYDNMEKYFPKDKIVITGNPVRKDILALADKRTKAIQHFGLDQNKKTILIIGGSLGARTINESILTGLAKLIEVKVQIIWQTGKANYEYYSAQLSNCDKVRIKVFEFVREMDLAYAVADLVVSRSGALAVSELCIARKPVILVPSPNVAEDHQTKNAMALVQNDAAIMIADKDANQLLVGAILKLLFDEQGAAKLSNNIGLLAKPEATNDIVNEIEKLITSLQPSPKGREKNPSPLEKDLG